MVRGDLLCANLMFGQPLTEVTDKANLQFRRMVGVAFGADLGCIGIQVRTQRPFMQTHERLRISEIHFHRSPPSRECLKDEEKTDRTMPDSSFDIP
jgi:hypothetical protein